MWLDRESRLSFQVDQKESLPRTHNPNRAHPTVIIHPNSLLEASPNPSPAHQMWLELEGYSWRCEPVLTLLQKHCQYYEVYSELLDDDGCKLLFIYYKRKRQLVFGRQLQKTISGLNTTALRSLLPVIGGNLIKKGIRI